MDGEYVMGKKVCGICNRDFDLEENKLGIVLDDELFICEDCHQKMNDDEKQQVFYSTVMHTTRKEMPIALWLIQEQNKDKPFLTMKR